MKGMWRLVAGLVALPALLIGSGWLFLPAGTITGWALVNLLLYPVIVVPSIALHECGHALVARLLGLHVPRIEIGISRRIARWRWRSTSIILNALPILGVTYLGADRSSGLRWRLWLTILAGPLTTLLIAIVALAALDVSVFEAFWPQQAVLQGPAIVELVAFQAIWFLVLNLLPFPLVGTHLGSDGTQLRRIPTADGREIEELLVMPAIFEAEELRDSDVDAAYHIICRAMETAPNSWALRNILALLLMQREQLSEARVLMLGLLEDQDSVARPPLALLIRNNLAWTDFLIGADELRDEADENSLVALVGFEDEGFALGTRGAILGWLGRHAEAIEMLQKAFLRNSDEVNRALNACSLACSFAATGSTTEATRWIERARASDPASTLLPRAEAAIERAVKADATGEGEGA